jgi:galactofuranosylgalactofuranosylrhamnosyl-N-acetylglucosaminyl-diphospho-decaprenol beta-1,5/1,6-galactofuranosyltransferase
MITLQTIIAPEQAICSEPDLYYRATAPVCTAQGRFTLPAGGEITFDTYFNLFNLGTWMRVCALTGLCLELTATGRLEIRIHHLPGHGGKTLIYRHRQTLSRATPYRVDLAALLAGEETGLLALEILAQGTEVTLQDARFVCRNSLGSTLGKTVGSTVQKLPRLAISITTYQRERKVRDTVARLQRFLAGFAFGDQIHVQVIDNGHSAKISNSRRVSSYSNPNFGGAGGFARGLLEAQDRGFSHCLFMDDDASFHMENIRRTYMLLALARDPATALAGAMISNRHKWEIWENGAYFDGSCHPLFNGTDLRQPGAVQQMELASDQPRPATYYGGWWFFAFPLARLRHHPFPFFVRGDDISFSLANDFSIVTLNGVVSFQDDFVEKESPQTLYLDLRNHLLHHLIFARLERSALGTARIACRFMMRSMLRCKYESAAAQLLAWRDVMQGPGFFDRNIDMQARQRDICTLIQAERWQEIRPADLVERRRFSRLPRRLRHYLGLLSLNGHLLPFWNRFADRMVLEIKDRGLVFPAFGGARLTYLNSARSRGYRLRHSKRRFFTLIWQMTLTLLRWQRQYGGLKLAYRRGYNEMTTRAYWEEKLQRSTAKVAPDTPDALNVRGAAAGTEPKPGLRAGRRAGESTGLRNVPLASGAPGAPLAPGASGASGASGQAAEPPTGPRRETTAAPTTAAALASAAPRRLSS